MAAAAQDFMKRDNLVLRRLLDDALARQATLIARLCLAEAGEDAPPAGTDTPQLSPPAETLRDFGGDPARENEALHRALSTTQFRIYRTAENLKLVERRAAGQGFADGVGKTSLPRRTLQTASTIYHEVLSLAGPAKHLVQSANHARDAREFAHAARLYAQACDAMPGHFRLWVQQGNMAKDAGLFQEAKAAYERARALQGDNVDLHMQIGHLHKMMGDLPGAGQAYCTALSLAPDHQDAYRELESLGYADTAKRIRAGWRR